MVGRVAVVVMVGGRTSGGPAVRAFQAGSVPVGAFVVEFGAVGSVRVRVVVVRAFAVGVFAV